jgi:NADH-quinone oxidoreductase subunit B
MTSSGSAVAGRDVRLAVVPMGLACCAVEVAAALRPIDLPEGWTVGPDPDADAHVLLVSGTVSEASLPVVLGRWAQLPRPRFCVSVGACADSGGPYWDSYAVVNGVDQLLPVDLYLPGCPPRPEAVLVALAHVAARVGVRHP